MLYGNAIVASTYVCTTDLFKGDNSDYLVRHSRLET